MSSISLLQWLLLSEEGRPLEKDNQKAGLVRKGTLFGRRALNRIITVLKERSVFNRIYNKTLNRNWFSARLFVTFSTCSHVAVQLIKGIQFELFVFTYTQFDTNVIFTSIGRALMASFAKFTPFF